METKKPRRIARALTITPKECLRHNPMNISKNATSFVALHCRLADPGCDRTSNYQYFSCSQ